MFLGPTTMINGVKLMYATPFIIVAGPKNKIFEWFLEFSTRIPHELEVNAPYWWKKNCQPEMLVFWGLHEGMAKVVAMEMKIVPERK